MRTSILSAIAFIVITIAGNAQWIRGNTGMYGSYIRTFASINSTVYCAGTRGVYASTTNGTTWKRISNETTMAYTNCVTSAGNKLFAGGSGVYYTSDNGTTWFPFSDSLPSNSILCLAVMGETLYAGTSSGGLYSRVLTDPKWIAIPQFAKLTIKSIQTLGSSVLVGTSAGLFFSEDAGKTWVEISGQMPKKNIQSVFIHKDYMLAACSGYGMYKSTDKGATWHNCLTGLAGGTFYAITQQNGKLFTSEYDLVFVSTDEGENWTRTHEVMAQKDNVTSTNLYVYAANNTVFVGSVAGVYTSQNDGAVWRFSSTGITYPDIVGILPYNKGLFVATTSGAYFSADMGKNWTEMNDSLNNMRSALCATVFKNDIYMGHYHGLAKYQSAQKYWNELMEIVGLGWPSDYVVSSDSVVVAINYNRFAVSSDSGKTWIKKSIAGTGTGRVLMYSYKTILYACVQGSGFYVSTDNGDSWTSQSSGLQSKEFQTFARMNNILFIGTRDKGISVKTVASDTWVESNTGLPYVNVRSIVVYKNQVFAVVSGSIYTSLDSAKTWKKVRMDNTTSWEQQVSLLAVISDTLYAGTASGLIKANIADLNASTLTIEGLNDIIITKNSTYTGVFTVVADDYSGVKFTAASTNTTLVPTDSIKITGNGPVFTLTISPVPNITGQSTITITVEAGTKSTSKTITFLVQNTSDVEYQLQNEITGVYPNPVTDVCTVTLTSELTALATIQLYNVAGNEVYTRTTTELVGTSTIEIPTGNLVNGIYLLRISNNNYISTHPIVVLR